MTYVTYVHVRAVCAVRAVCDVCNAWQVGHSLEETLEECRPWRDWIPRLAANGTGSSSFEHFDHECFVHRDRKSVV